MGHECFFTCACNGAMSHKLHANLLLKTWYVRSVKNIKSINSIDDVQGSDINTHLYSNFCCFCNNKRYIKSQISVNAKSTLNKQHITRHERS